MDRVVGAGVLSEGWCVGEGEERGKGKWGQDGIALRLFRLLEPTLRGDLFVMKNGRKYNNDENISRYDVINTN